jgi:hypothetical protein
VEVNVQVDQTAESLQSLARPKGNAAHLARVLDEDFAGRLRA